MIDVTDARAHPAGNSPAADPLDRVGCSLLTFHERTLEEALDRVVAHGFRRMDLAVVPGHCDHVDLLALSVKDMEKLADTIARRGLTVSSLNLHPGNMAAPDFELTGARIRAAIELARHLGAPVLTLPPGPASAPEAWDEVAGVVAGRVRSFLDPAEQAGLTLSLEAPHAHTLAEDVTQARRLFERVGDRRIACTLDTSHVQRGNRTPLVDALSRLGVPVAHVHLRDTLRGEITVTPGKGDCEYLPFLRKLLDDGYPGDLNFELEYEGASPDRVERELDFACEHVRLLLRGEPLPFSHRVHHQAWFRSLDQAAWVLRNPKAFVVARPRLKAVLRPPVRLARSLRTRLTPHREILYRSGWAPTWRLGRSVSAIAPRRPTRAASPEAAKRVAILGCGYTGRYEHGPGFSRLPGAAVVGVCDVREERARFLGAQLGCPSFTDAAELLRTVKPDLVVNCTREWQHRETTLAAFASGADVFCEKILAETLESGEALVRAAREGGRVLGVNYNWRFLPGIQRIRAIRDSGELGKLRMLRILAHAWVSHHALDLARFLGGPIESVSATILDEPGTRGLAEWNPYAGELLYMPTVYSVSALRTRDGVGVSLASSELLDPTGMLLSLDAVFQEGTVTLSGILDADAMGTLTASTRKRIDLRMRRGDAPAGFALSFQRSIEAFFASYCAGATPPTSGQDALEVMRVENALVRSHRTGTRITL